MVDSSHVGGRRPLPPEDLALFLGLQPPEVRAAAESKIQAYRAMIEDIKGYISQLMTIQNTTAPLHATLPPEILMNVFRHVFPTRRCHIRLTHVCKLWRDLIHRTPEFWADMLAVKAVTRRLDHSADPLLSYSTFMERSSPLPYKLDVHMNLAVLTTVPLHVSRICTLSLSLPLSRSCYVARLSTLLSLHMPLLETMQCRSDMTDEDDDPTVLLDRGTYPRPCGENFPRLHTLSLFGQWLASRAFTFSSLRKLTLNDGGYVLDPQSLLDLLEGCPHLQTLEMHIQAPVLHVTSPGRAVVSLPHLRTFSLVLPKLVEWWAREFLTQVQLAEATQMKIIWESGADVSLNTLIPASPLAGVQAIQAIHVLDIRYFPCEHDDTRVIRANGFVPDDPNPRLVLQIHDQWWWEARARVNLSHAIANLARLFAHVPSIKSLKIHVQCRVGIKPEQWLVILDALPFLSSLTVHIDSCRNVLTVLRGNPTRWPNLVRLSISCRNGTGVHESLLAAVEVRAREGTPLEYLAFSGDTKKPLSAHRMHRLGALVREVATVDKLGP